MVDYYGSPTPLNQVSNISTPDAKTIMVQPWEKNMIDTIEKALMNSNVGITPSNNGEVIRLGIPQLTEERRKDLFKEVNDTGGHAAGDLILKGIANILKLQTRAGDTVARVGGDEFALLLDGCPQSRAQEIAEAIRENIGALKVAYEGRDYSVKASIGISYGQGGTHSATGMLKAADAACYSAKEDGRNRICINPASDLFQTTDRFELAQYAGQL